LAEEKKKPPSRSTGKRRYLPPFWTLSAPSFYMHALLTAIET
jgi:hypothetical protein